MYWVSFELIIIYYNLLNYGNNKIEKISIKENNVRNSLYGIDSSIDDKVKFRFDFFMSIEFKELLRLKEFQRRDKIIINERNNTQISREEIIENFL